MAKTCWLEREKRKSATVAKYAVQRAELKAKGVRLIDETPRPGAHNSLVAFIHPSSAHGVLIELKQVK